MKTLKLSDKDLQLLEEQHRESCTYKERDRIKAILLRYDGWTIKKISKLLTLSPSTIERYIKDYEAGKLSPAERGGSESKLSEPQTKELVSHLTKHTYQSTESIIEHIKKTYQITYSVPGLNKWLHRNGFSYKKATGRPHKADTTEQEKFIKKYKRLKDKSDAKNPILFMDSVHPTQATKLGYGWIRTGQTKEISTNASRTRMNLIGAINLKRLTKPVIKECDSVNGSEIVDFLEQIKKAYAKAKEIHLVLDQAGYHKSKLVKKAAKRLNIKLHYLPPYSPNLNPIERLWKLMNEYARNNKFFKSTKKFNKEIYYFFRLTIPTIKDTISNRINDNFQILKPAHSS